jgi:hypothetical protein
LIVPRELVSARAGARLAVLPFRDCGLEIEVPLVTPTDLGARALLTAASSRWHWQQPMTPLTPRTLIHIAVLGGTLAVRAWAADSATMRAADAGVSPEFCPALRALVAAADTNFTSLRGRERTGGEHVWEGTKRLPGASDCTVYGGQPAAYACMLYAGDVEDNADGTYDRAASALKDCLPVGWKTSEQVNGTHARTMTAAAGDGPRVRVVSRDVSGDAYLVEVWVDGVRR